MCLCAVPRYSYFVATQYFVFFVGTYICLVATLVYRSAVSATASKSKLQQALVGIAAGVYVGGFLLLWLPEHYFCVRHPVNARPTGTFVERAQLHAWFHLTSTIGPYAWILFAQLERFSKSGAELEVSGHLLPTVVLHKRTE